MTIIVVSVILAGLAIAFFTWVIVATTRQRKKALARLLRKLSKLGTENNLSFSSQEILKNSIIGLDGVHRKLLIFNKNPEDHYHAFLVDLEDVKRCTVKKLYVSTNENDWGMQRSEGPIDRIILFFEFFGQKPPVEVSFYQQSSNTYEELPVMEQKARDWEILLSKMLNPRLRRSA